WSSDVCSSDLALAGIMVHLKFLAMFMHHGMRKMPAMLVKKNGINFSKATLQQTLRKQMNSFVVSAVSFLKISKQHLKQRLITLTKKQITEQHVSQVNMRLIFLQRILQKSSVAQQT